MTKMQTMMVRVITKTLDNKDVDDDVEDDDKDADDDDDEGVL